MPAKRPLSVETVARLVPAHLPAQKQNGTRRHQVHFWLAASDYQFLQTLAKEEEEPMSRIIRRLIRHLRSSVSDHGVSALSSISRLDGDSRHRK